MQTRRTQRDSELSAILISPNREMAETFLATVPRVRGFQILGDLRTYPSQQTLEIRLRQLQPEVALIDLSTNLEQAGELIRFLSGLTPAVQVIGLHAKDDSEVILKAVRLGATEFLFAPFDTHAQQDAIARLKKLRQPEPGNEPDHGRVIVFSSSKPGAGSSTLATQTAFALKRMTGKRVLLADLDLTGGAIGFYLKLAQRYSLIDILNGTLDVNSWSNYTVTCGGVDILSAPDIPHAEPPDPARVQEVLQFVRFLYDWVILDLPTIFHRLSLLALSEADRAFLVSTSELPSLHLTRKAIGLLQQLGFGRDRFQVLVNRVNRRDGLAGNDLGKLFECPVFASFPNDYFSLHRVITLGRPLANDCDLGKSIEGLASKLAGSSAAERKRLSDVLSPKPVFSQS